MATYLKLLGTLLILAGLAGSVFCWQGALHDEAYFRALRALEKYPGNVLYTTEFRVAQPRHMLLVAGAYASGALGVVLGSLSVGLGVLIGRVRVSS